VTGEWGANTFSVSKQLPNPYLQNPQTFVFLVFLALSLNKCWWRISSFSPLETNALAFSHPRRRVGCDSWRLHWGRYRELGHSISVQYNLCYVVVFGVCLFIDYIHS